ncbi:MAG: chromosomal replication initiator protein DnaA [Bdellovibrionales bacterium]|nr:chromosomal replication initiator protein DnaA [Bdellovibrionales bacterium]
MNSSFTSVSPSVAQHKSFHGTQGLPSATSPYSDIWQAVLRILESSLVPQQLSTWIQPLELIGYEHTPSAHPESSSSIRVTLLASNSFSASWVRDHFLSALELAFGQVAGSRVEIQFEIGDSAQTSKNIGSSSAAAGAEKLDSWDAPAASQAASVAQPSILAAEVVASPGNPTSVDARYCFDSFVVGASNQFAHASALAVAEQPLRPQYNPYNPLFIYSPPGLGKTHLLHAIGNKVAEKNPSARIAYLSAERFVNELVESLQHKRMSQFRTRYRDSYDLILMDDVQFIAGKKQTEEEFFHTFNALHTSRRQIVVTSDRPPKEIEGLEERIRTRFEWGMVADIHSPEIETRIAILKSKAERDDIYLPDDVATFIATYVKSSIRELEGSLVKLQFQASLTGSEISLEMAKQILRSLVPSEGSTYTIEAIQSAVAKYFGIKSQDFKSTSRARQVALPRQIAMYLIRKYSKLSFNEIGHYFGGKDHSTIVHACKKIEGDLETDESIRQAVEAVQNQL